MPHSEDLLPPPTLAYKIDMDYLQKILKGTPTMSVNLICGNSLNFILMPKRSQICQNIDVSCPFP